MSDWIDKFIKPYAKAITAAIVGAIVLVAAKAGLNLNDDVTLAITTLVAAGVNGVLVYLVPNKPAE